MFVRNGCEEKMNALVSFSVGGKFSIAPQNYIHTVGVVAVCGVAICASLPRLHSTMRFALAVALFAGAAAFTPAPAVSALRHTVHANVPSMQLTPAKSAVRASPI
jgi:hypothetical protein